LFCQNYIDAKLVCQTVGVALTNLGIDQRRRSFRYQRRCWNGYVMLAGSSWLVLIYFERKVFRWWLIIHRLNY
jgi:hypothetical protein